MTVATRPPFERELMIRFSHCDPAGIVFFPQYLVMLNNLVEDWFTEELGIAYAELLGPRRVGLPTVSLSCEFTAPSRMGETVALGLAIERIGGASITLRLGCRLGDQARMSARQVLVATSLVTHRAIPLPDDVRAALEHFQSAHPTKNSGDSP
jgi:4-hydroxybenzoyl-CoA thioesterase